MPQNKGKNKFVYIKKVSHLCGIIMTKKERKKDLLNFFLFFRNNGEQLIGITIEQLVDKYLKQEQTKK